MLQERVLVRVSQVLSLMLVICLIYTHFCGWFYPKKMIIEDTKEYLLSEGYPQEAILQIRAEYDYRAENKYCAIVKLLDDEQGIIDLSFAYDVEENIYKLGEK